MKLCGKEFKIPEINFEIICLLEELGISFNDILRPKKKMMSIIRAFVSISTGLDSESASTMIEEHLANDGNFDGIYEEINKAMEDSRFFQIMAKRAEKKE